MGRRSRWAAPRVGDYKTEYWPYEWKNGREYKPGRPDHRDRIIERYDGTREQTPDDWYWGKKEYAEVRPSVWTPLSDEEILAAPITKDNAEVSVFRELAKVLAHYGYRGPVKPGEAVAVRNAFKALGLPDDLVRQGWVEKSVTVKSRPTRRQIRMAARLGVSAPTGRVYKTTRLQRCWVFKSPLDGVDFTKFIKLCRMYKGDRVKLRGAIKSVMENPEAHKEIESVDVIELLAGLKGDV